MKTWGRSGQWRLAIVSLAVWAVLWGWPGDSRAEEKYWVAGSGVWDVSDNYWNPPGVPQAGDLVYLINTGAADITVSYRNTINPGATYGILNIGAGGSGMMTLDQSWVGNFGSISSTGEYVGCSVGYKGTHTQSTGVNQILGELRLANMNASEGIYNLSGGSLYSYSQYIGYKGTGTFNHSGGTNTADYSLRLGEGGGIEVGFGTYNLSGSGKLTVANNHSQVLNGVFNQTGGSHTITSGFLVVAPYGSDTAAYNLQDGVLTAANVEITGNGGVFTQSGGTSTVSGSLQVASPGHSGAYNLQGGSLAAGTVSLYGGGVFSQTGGTLNATTFNQQGGTVQGVLENRGTFNYSSGDFQGRMLNYGSLSHSGTFTLGDGMANYSSLELAAGRTLNVNGQGLDNSGTITLGGGTLAGDGPLVNNGQITGYGTIAAGIQEFTNNGFLTQSGGNLTLARGASNFGNIDLAQGKFLTFNSEAYLSNYGALNLNQAIVNGSGTLVNNPGGVISGRGTISSAFNNSGVLVLESGTTNITQEFGNGGLIQLHGLTANLAGATINNYAGTIQGFGAVSSSVTNTGIIEALGGTLTLGGMVSNQAGQEGQYPGQIFASAGNKVLVTQGLRFNQGIINLTGGTYDNNNRIMTSYGQISGYGTFRTGGLSNIGTMTLSGGTTTVNGNVTNDSAGTINVAHNPAIFTGDVTNYGQVKTTGTTVTWAGTFTNSGAYISDPSYNYFGDLVVTSDGWLEGGAGDLYSVSGNFLSQSTQNINWNTVGADLAFTGGGTHQLDVTGTDLGGTSAGYSNNFAWGSLDLSGQTLNLHDASAGPGGALYVREILGLLFGSPIVTNIYGNGLNIYYDPTLPGNEYLHSATYALQGGGELIPTPLPGSAWLLISGLAGLWGARRWKTKKSGKA